ncbi:MAG: glycoside hydrolase family 97 protein [Paludibacter sp.]|nr:glycoside hydrolase family 97 protein [Paludibacter sp.]
MTRYLFTYFIILAACSFQTVTTQNVQALKSPNAKLCITLSFDKEGELSYNLSVNNKLFINHSTLGFENGNEVIPSKEWVINEVSRTSISSDWKPIWGKRTIVKEEYNEMIFSFTSIHKYKLSSLSLQVRAYNDGVAFRYLIPDTEKKDMTATAELTKFNFAGDYTAWFYNFEHHNIGPEKLSWSSGQRMPVMTIEADKKTYLAIHEADLEMGEPLILRSERGSTSFSVASALTKLTAGYHTAWRTIMYGETVGALVDSHLLELLNPEPKSDFSWVKPGVAVWDWRIDGAVVDDFKYSMNYPSWVRMVDFAAENNIKHLILDANWYGPEHETDSDPINGDKANDVQKIIQYANEKNIGVWLYLNDVGGRKFPIEKTLKQYSDWGAAGIKYGFMQGSPAEKNSWTRKITEICAQNKLLCNFHDGPVHPYGQMRTFPNALTREYCQAQLDAHRVFQPKTFLTSVFVNMIAGPIDMNNGMFDLRQGNTTRVDENQPVPSTLVSEAARTLIVFSGATVIPDIPEYYRKYPDLLRFIASQKMPWKESKTLDGKIGEYIVMARKSADDVWLIAAATNEIGRKLTVSLQFLEAGSYDVTIIQDAENGHYLTNRETLKVQNIKLTSTNKINLKLAPGGGACVVLKKK